MTMAQCTDVNHELDSADARAVLLALGDPLASPPAVAFVALSICNSALALAASCSRPIQQLSHAHPLVLQCASARGSWKTSLELLLPRLPSLLFDLSAGEVLPEDVINQEREDVTIPTAVADMLWQRKLGNLSMTQITALVESAWASTHVLQPEPGAASILGIQDGLCKLDMYLTPLLRLLGFDAFNEDNGLSPILARLTTFLRVDADAVVVDKANGVIMAVMREAAETFQMLKHQMSPRGLLPVCNIGGTTHQKMVIIECLLETKRKNRRDKSVTAGAQPGAPAGVPIPPPLGAAGPQELVAASAVAEGSRANQFSTTSTYYKQGGLRFHRQALENHLQQTYRMAPGSYNMSYLLVASIDPVFCLTWVSNTGLRSVQPIILPNSNSNSN